MILGIGIDLVNISKIEEQSASDVFVRKVFGREEIEEVQSRVSPGKLYAGKFAAKEAFMKAIQQGIRQEIWFTQITVLLRDTGEPYVELSGKAKQTATELGISRVHVSISHTKDIAVSVVIVEK